MNEKAKPLHKVAGFDLYNLFDGVEGMTDPSALATLISGYAEALHTFLRSDSDLLLILLKSWQMFSSANLYESSFGRNLSRFKSLVASFKNVDSNKGFQELLPSDLTGVDSVVFASEKDLEMYVEDRFPYLFGGAAMAGGLTPGSTT